MKGSYQFEALESRQKEAAFLAERAQLRLDEFPALLKRHGYPSSDRTLEVGCGHGIRTRIMAQLFPNTHVTGLDRSTELLDLARRDPESGLANLTFNSGDLYELPYADDTFDFVYARLVFMHLQNPHQALKELRRVLRPGGRILIEDADRDCMFFEPAPLSLLDFWRNVQEAQRKLGGDPNVGRRLAPYLKENDFVNLNIETQPIIGSGNEIRFLVQTLLPSLNLYQQSALERSQGEAAIQDLARLAEDPRATFYHFWFVVSGQKPQP
jgi:SAM-dependent methyltransferase